MMTRRDRQTKGRLRGHGTRGAQKGFHALLLPATVHRSSRRPPPPQMPWASIPSLLLDAAPALLARRSINSLYMSIIHSPAQWAAIARTRPSPSMLHALPLLHHCSLAPCTHLLLLAADIDGVRRRLGKIIVEDLINLCVWMCRYEYVCTNPPTLRVGRITGPPPRIH